MKIDTDLFANFFTWQLVDTEFFFDKDLYV